MGRKKGIRRTTSQWRSLMDNQKQSGLTVEQFCKHHGLTQSYFYLWRKKLAADTPDHLIKPDSSGHAQWVNVSPPASVAEGDVRCCSLARPQQRTSLDASGLIKVIID